MKINIFPSSNVLKTHVLVKAFIVFTILFLITAAQLLNAQVVAVQSGNWNDASTWSTGIPTASDDVSIANSFVVTINTTGAVCNQLRVGLGDNTNNGGIEFIGTSSLTVTNTIVLGDVAGAVGAITMDTDATLTCNAITEDDPGISAVYNTNIGSIVFTGTCTLPENLYQFNHLTILSGTTTLAYTNIQIDGNLSIENGATLDIAAFSANRSATGGTCSIANGGTLIIGGTGTLPLNYSTHSIGASSTINYNGSSQTVSVLNSSQNYGNLLIQGSGTKQLNGNITIAGNVTVTAGILNLSTYTANRNTAGGTLSIANGATLRIAGSGTLPANFTTHAIASGSTIEYRGTSAQNIAPLQSGQQYSNLIITNSVKTLVADIAIAGTLTFGGTPNKLNIGSNTITLLGSIAGSLTSSRNFSCSSNSNIVMDGTINRTIYLDQTTPGTTNAIKNFTINHSAYTTSLGNDIVVTGNLAFNGGKLALAGKTITINGAIINTVADGITGSTTSKIIVSGTQNINLQFDQTTDGSTNIIKDITINSPSYTTTIGSNVKIADNITVTAGTLNLGTYACNRTTAGGTLSIGNSGTLIVGSNNTLPTNFTTHSLGTSSTVEYGGGTQTIAALNTNQLYANLVISGSGVKSLPGSLTVMNNLVFNSSKLAIGTDTLTISGNITNTTTEGLIGSANSNLVFNSTVYSPSISFDQSIPGTSNVLKNLVLDCGSSTLQLQNALNLGGTLLPTSGTLSSNGNLTLLSKASGTAAVATGGTAGGYITGDVTVERYISSGRKWQFISVATDGTQSISNAWQEGEAIGSVNATGYGTWLTSPDANATSLGFDYRSNTVSIKKYNSNNNTWTPLADTYGAIAADEGYMVFIRGDRGCTSNNTDVSSTVLRSKGTLKQGNQTAINVASGKNKSIANVYACAIDFRNINKTGGINNAFYVWDPKLYGTQGFGAYQTFTLSGGNYIVTPGGGSYGAGGSVCNTIQPGQAFFVYAGGGSGTIQLLESAKSIGNILVSKPNNTVQQLSINLFDGKKLIDGVMIECNAAEQNNVNTNDALKLTVDGISIGIKKNNMLLSVEKRKPFIVNDTIFLSTAQNEEKLYEWQIAFNNINNPTLAPYFEDNSSKTSVLLNYYGINKIGGIVKNKTPATNRFYIVFKPKKMAISNIFYGKKQTETSIKIIQNPIVNKQLQLFCTNTKNGNYQVVVYNTIGQVIAHTNFVITSNNQTKNIQLPPQVIAGNYVIELLSTDGEKIILQAIIN